MNLLISFLLCGSKLNIFRLWTRQNIWRHHLGVLGNTDLWVLVEEIIKRWINNENNHWSQAKPTLWKRKRLILRWWHTQIIGFRWLYTIENTTAKMSSWILHTRPSKHKCPFTLSCNEFVLLLKTLRRKKKQKTVLIITAKQSAFQADLQQRLTSMYDALM